APHAPYKADPSYTDRQRLLVGCEVVGQAPHLQGATHLCCRLEIQLWMDLLLETASHHRLQFATYLRGRMQLHGQQAFLQPAIEALDRAIAPGFALGDEGQLHADQQGQANEAVERTAMRGMSEQ